MVPLLDESSDGIACSTIAPTLCRTLLATCALNRGEGGFVDGGACRCQRLGVLSRVIFSPLRSAWSMWIWSGNQDEAADPAKETDGAKRCQMVPNGATLVLLPPVTTGSEEDPGAQPDDWTQGLRLSLEGIRGGTVEDHFLVQLLPVLLFP